MLQLPLFWKALGNTLYFVVVGVPLSIALSLGCAVLLQSPLARFKPFFRTALFAPVVTTLVAVARDLALSLPRALWPASTTGSRRFGIEPIDWLGDPHWAMPAIILFAVWKNFGANMIIFIAALQAIPDELYEAARIDGARAWQQFVHVTLPMLGADAVAGQHPDDGRLLPALRRALRDDAGRAAAEHGVACCT